MNNINRQLKKVREEKGMNFLEIAKKLNISKPYYWQIENGKRNLYYSLALKIADVLETKPDELFYEYYKNIKK